MRAGFQGVWFTKQDLGLILPHCLPVSRVMSQLATIIQVLTMGDYQCEIKDFNYLMNSNPLQLLSFVGAQVLLSSARGKSDWSQEN